MCVASVTPFCPSPATLPPTQKLSGCPGCWPHCSACWPAAAQTCSAAGRTSLRGVALHRQTPGVTCVSTPSRCPVSTLSSANGHKCSALSGHSSPSSGAAFAVCLRRCAVWCSLAVAAGLQLLPTHRILLDRCLQHFEVLLVKACIVSGWLQQQ